MKPLAYERRILIRALLAGLSGSTVGLVLLWTGQHDPKIVWTLTIVIVVSWLAFAFSAQSRVTFPLRTVSNMLAALHEGDFSIRARGAETPDALGEVMREVNALGETLYQQRLGAVEATALLRKVMEEIDIAVFAFDSSNRLRLLNRAGEHILNRPAERALGRTAKELGVEICLTVETPHVAQIAFPGKMGRWEIHRGNFREGGKPHQLVVISDLSQALREEERLAWQRLIRVIGHELNNSLAPIKSIAESLSGLMARSKRPSDWEDDLSRGLTVIASRTDGLSRFMNAYSRLARLPAPQFRPMEVGPWVLRSAALDPRMQIPVQAGPELTIQADPDQLDQVLINLVKNAVEAASETGGGVNVGWEARDGTLEVWVRDEGPGIPSAANLFVPFFTTKPSGSGIGLVLSRQIAEAHGGSLSLENVAVGHGCEARLRLPVNKN
ncbi:MAG TPA: ATP-binding protein [Candidatus Acidoferrales bacterium]|nr:ATP-binding protein [Candidatus Acidoferrales bacterium]